MLQARGLQLVAAAAPAAGGAAYFQHMMLFSSCFCPTHAYGLLVQHHTLFYIYTCALA
jgi:hypothetical protein